MCAQTKDIIAEKSSFSPYLQIFLVTIFLILQNNSINSINHNIKVGILIP